MEKVDLFFCLFIVCLARVKGPSAGTHTHLHTKTKRMKPEQATGVSETIATSIGPPKDTLFFYFTIEETIPGPLTSAATSERLISFKPSGNPAGC